MIKLFLSLFLLSACEPSKVTISEDTTQFAEEEPASLIHGGSPVPEEWDDCGGEIGDHPCNMSLVDQYSDTFELYDNYGKVIVLDFSSTWCGICNLMAHDAQEFMDEYGDNNFLWVTILIENDQGEPPTEEDIQNWVNLYGIVDAPVVAGDRSLIDLTAESGWPIAAWPTLVVIDREMIVKYGINGWNETTIRSWVESEL